MLRSFGRENAGALRVRLERRFSLKSTADVAVAASAVAVQAIGPALVLPKFAADQALQILALAAIVADSNATGKLTSLSGAVGLVAGANDTGLHWFQPNYANILLGPTGLRWGTEYDELVAPTDYREIISAADVGDFQLWMFADMSNSDAGASHDVHMSLTALFALYQVLPFQAS